MNIAGRDMYVGNDVVLMIYRSMIQVEEALRFAVSDHITTVRVGCTHFNLLFLFHLLPGLQGFFPLASRSARIASSSSFT